MLTPRGPMLTLLQVRGYANLNAYRRVAFAPNKFIFSQFRHYRVPPLHATMVSKKIAIDQMKDHKGAELNENKSEYLEIHKKSKLESLRNNIFKDYNIDLDSEHLKEKVHHAAEIFKDGAKTMTHKVDDVASGALLTVIEAAEKSADAVAANYNINVGFGHRGSNIKQYDKFNELDQDMRMQLKFEEIKAQKMEYNDPNQKAARMQRESKDLI